MLLHTKNVMPNKKTQRRKQRAAAPAGPTRRSKPRRQAPRGGQNVGLAPAPAPGGVAKPNRGAVGLMEAKITGQEASAAQYILGLTTPNMPCRVPVVLGEFELDTNTYSYVFNGTTTATAGGFAHVSACNDCWHESGNDGGPLSQYIAYTTGGYPVWSTPAGSAATSTPANGAVSSADLARSQLPVLDSGFGAGTRGRCTAIIMSVWADSPATTTQGDVCIAAVASEQALDDFALNSATFATVAAYPQEYVTHMEFPLAGWRSGEQAHIAPIPFSENCFVMQFVPTTGTATVASIACAAIITGAASGQTIRYRVEYKYETTAPKSYQTGTESITAKHMPVPLETVAPHLQALRPKIAIKAPPAVLPAVAMAAMKEADSSLFSKVVSAASAGGLGKTVSKLVGSAVKNIPYVGGFLGSAFDSIFG